MAERGSQAETIGRRATRSTTDACAHRGRAPCSAGKETPLRNWSALLAFVATIMLVIAGGPSVATAAACDPCPPDCPMMAPASPSAAAMDDHGKAPAQGQAPQKSSCVQTGLCQAASVAPLMVGETAAVLHLPRNALRHDLVSDRAAPSRPPDRELRPPIRL